MTRWADLAAAEPGFASTVRALFDARRHKVIATLRADGSPRLSGIETTFDDGEILLGMMPGSLKAKDLRRDPRLAVHAASDDPDDADPSAWAGDAKVSGRGVAIDRAPGGGPDAEWFRVEIGEVVVTRVGAPADHLEITSWDPVHGLRVHRRK